MVYASNAYRNASHLMANAPADAPIPDDERARITLRARMTIIAVTELWDIKQMEMAKNLGVSDSQISKVKSGANLPMPGWCRRFLNEYGVGAGWLVDGDPLSCPPRIREKLEELMKDQGGFRALQR